MEDTSTNIPTTVRELVDLWPSRLEVADDIDASVAQVHKWVQHNSIPAKYHWKIVTAAKTRKFALTAEDMLRLHSLDGDLSQDIAEAS